jgi:hypothetical protein
MVVHTCDSNYLEDMGGRINVQGLSWEKSMTPYLKK